MAGFGYIGLGILTMVLGGLTAASYDDWIAHREEQERLDRYGTYDGSTAPDPLGRALRANRAGGCAFMVLGAVLVAVGALIALVTGVVWLVERA